tara:strand:+ start:2729 stop:3304 length:576 start_codon:yes stop_codon:yes gene_type:complete
MSNKLSDKDLAFIMSYADGQIEPSNIAYVEKLINENDEAKKVFEDLSLTSNVYKDYVSSIDDNSQKILAKSNESLEKVKTGFFHLIFKNPIRNFIAYPIAAVFMFTIGFQMNSTSFLGLNNDTEQFRGLKNNENNSVNTKVSQQIDELNLEIKNLRQIINTISDDNSSKESLIIKIELLESKIELIKSNLK